MEPTLADRLLTYLRERLGAVLGYAGAAGESGAERASRAVYEGVLETVATGTKTIDLGGAATTSEFTDAVVEKVRTKVDVWSSLGTKA